MHQPMWLVYTTQRACLWASYRQEIGTFLILLNNHLKCYIRSHMCHIYKGSLEMKRNMHSCWSTLLAEECCVFMWPCFLTSHRPHEVQHDLNPVNSYLTLISHCPRRQIQTTECTFIWSGFANNLFSCEKKKRHDFCCCFVSMRLHQW